MGKKREEYLEFLRIVDPDGDFAGLVPIENSAFDGSIHSVLELKTGEAYLSQGESWNGKEFVVAIDRKGRYEELQPDEYEIVEVLQWDPETDELNVVPYKKEE